MSAAQNPLVRSGLTELAASALSGWVFTLCRTQPQLARKMGIKSVPRIRQWHLDMAALGTASVACGLAVPNASPRIARALLRSTVLFRGWAERSGLSWAGC